MASPRLSIVAAITFLQCLLLDAATAQVYQPATQAGDIYTAIPATPNITGSGAGNVNGVLDASAAANYTITIETGVNIIATDVNPGSGFQDSIVLGTGTHLLTVDGALAAGTSGLGVFGLGTAVPTVNIGSTGSISAPSATGLTLRGGGTVNNSGAISGGNYGVFYNVAPGTVNNLAGGTITGTGSAAIRYAFGGVFTNAGQINGHVSFESNALIEATLITGGTITGDLNLSSNTSSQLILDGTGTQLYSTAVTGTTTFTGSLTKQGSGTWILDQAFLPSGDTLIEEGTLIVTESLDSPNVYVGYSNNNSHLRISDGGIVGATSSTIGVESNNNTATVTGAGSSWINSGTLNVGYGGTGNILTIQNSGLASTQSGVVVGGLASADENQLIVTGSSSGLVNTGDISVGYEGSANSLTISAGGIVGNANAFVGWAATSDNNRVTVTGSSTWSNSGTLYLGHDGSGNELTISDGASVEVSQPAQDALIGFSSGSNNNKLIVTSGAVFLNDATLYVGNNGSGNRLEISDSARVSTQNARIGGGAGSSNNVAIVDDASWINDGTLRVGSNGSENELTIRNGGSVVVVGNAFVGYSATSHDNTVRVRGGSLAAGSLTVGRDGTGNQVIVSGDGILTASGGITLAMNAGSSGSLILGEGKTAGQITAPFITGGLGTAEIELNHNVQSGNLQPNLTGNLSVRSVGSGTTYFLGANSYTGGTTVTGGGYLAILDADDLGTGRITLDNGGLQWSRDSVDLSGRLNPLGAGGGLFKVFIRRVTFGSPISGEGSVTLTGGGHLVLQVENEYKGKTIVASGRLTTEVSGALPEGTDLILGTANSELAGTVDLHGTDQKIESIAINQGHIDPRDNIVTSSDGRANLTILGAKTNSVFDGLIIGNIAVHKEGRETTLTLLGDQIYTGGTFVKEGGLILGDKNTESALTGDVTVSEGAFFSGSGTIGGSLINAGTFSPGYSPGTMQIGKNFTLESTSRLVIEIASKTSYDKLIVDGKAKLGGTLRLDLLGGYEPETGDEFELISARRITGRFAAIEQAADGLFSLVVQGGQLILVWNSSTREPYQEYAQTQNQYNVAVALEQLRTSGNNADFNNNIRPVLDTLPPNGLVQAFEAIMPSQAIAFSQTTFARSKTWLPQMQTRLADIRVRTNPVVYATRGAADMKDVLAPEANRWSAWVDGAGVFNQTASFDGLRSGDASTAAGTVGADYRVSDNFIAGLYAGYIGTWNDFGSSSEVNSNGTRFGIYSTYQNGGFYLNNVVGGEWNSYDWKRRIAFPGVDRLASADTAGTNFETMFAGGYDWKVNDWATVGAFSSLEYTLVSVDQFTESGAGALNLRVQDQDADSLRTNLGVQFAGVIPINQRSLRPSLRVAWRHEYLDGNRTVNSALAGGAGPGFNTLIPGGNRQDSLLLNGGFSMDLTDDVSGYVYYTGDLGDGSVENVHAVNAGLRWEF